MRGWGVVEKTLRLGWGVLLVQEDCVDPVRELGVRDWGLVEALRFRRRVTVVQEDCVEPGVV